MYIWCWKYMCNICMYSGACTGDINMICALYAYMASPSYSACLRRMLKLDIIKDAKPKPLNLQWDLQELQVLHFGLNDESLPCLTPRSMLTSYSKQENGLKDLEGFLYIHLRPHRSIPGNIWLKIFGEGHILFSLFVWVWNFQGFEPRLVLRYARKSRRDWTSHILGIEQSHLNCYSLWFFNNSVFLCATLGTLCWWHCKCRYHSGRHKAAALVGGKGYPYVNLYLYMAYCTQYVHSNWPLFVKCCVYKYVNIVS